MSPGHEGTGGRAGAHDRSGLTKYLLVSVKPGRQSERIFVLELH